MVALQRVPGRLPLRARHRDEIQVDNYTVTQLVLTGLAGVSGMHQAGGVPQFRTRLDLSGHEIWKILSCRARAQEHGL